jgi:PAS domain S-box-containing protein
MLEWTGLSFGAAPAASLPASYHAGLVLLSVLVAMAASYTALDMASRVSQSQGRAARLWLLGGAFAMGAGIWSMHFVGMLAFSLPIRMAYDFGITLASLLVAIVISGFALRVVSRPTLPARTLLIAGLFMGLGICAMHYTGMAAMRMAPPIRYDPWLFAASVLIAVGASIVALWLAFTLRARMMARALQAKALAAMVMGLAISGMHYTGMAAANFEAGSVCRALGPAVLADATLGFAIGIVALALLLVTLMASLFDARLTDHMARMLQQVAQANQELKANIELTRSVIDTAFDAYIAMDSEGCVLDWNRQAELTFGYAREQALGRPLAELIIPPSHRAAHWQGLKRYLETGEGPVINQRIEVNAQHRDGHEFPVELTIWVTQTGGALRFNAFLHDIAERQRMADELQRSNRELEQFAYVASHDLQAPLRAVAGFVQLLQEKYRGRLDADADEYIGHIVSATHSMRQLIQALLELGRIGKKDLDFRRVALQQVLDEARQRLQAVIEERAAVIHSEQPLPELVVDPVLAVQLLQNLLSNAIKFQPGERPAVEIKARRGEGEWVVAVRDHGIGIDPKHFERIFRIFQRLHTADEYEGSGVGLAICEKIVQLHGGRIWVESEAGKGSTFYFSIPDRQLAQAA